MNRIVSTKNFNAVFLAVILVAGTITLFSPSFMTEANAQAESYYGMENGYGSYEPEPREYQQQYTDKKYSSHEPEYVMDNNNNYQKPYGEDRYGPTEYPDNNYYNSYGYSDYGKDSSYDDRKSYDKKQYGNDNGYDKSQYQSSYKPDYKSKYPSYEKDNNYKSKDSSSVSLNKLNCINNNVNINGNNNGTINVGNSGSSGTGDEGYIGVGSSGGYGEEGYDNNGYNKQKDKGFTCIINNNNINNNFGAGNATDGNVTEPLSCEECFQEFLTPEEILAFEGVSDIDLLCTPSSGGQDETAIRNFLTFIGVSEDRLDNLFECLVEAGIVFI